MAVLLEVEGPAQQLSCLSIRYIKVPNFLICKTIYHFIFSHIAINCIKIQL